MTETNVRTRRKPEAPSQKELEQPAWLSLPHVLAWLALSVLFTLLVLQYSMNRGKLIVPAHYDDVSYLHDGLMKLDGFYRAGLSGLVAHVASIRPIRRLKQWRHLRVLRFSACTIGPPMPSTSSSSSCFGVL